MAKVTINIVKREMTEIKECNKKVISKTYKECLQINQKKIRQTGK